MPKYDIEAYHSLFPFTESGKIYLNHASTSPLSIRILDSIQKYLTEKSVGDLEPLEEVLRTIVATKDLLGKLINCSRDRIALLDNTSNGLNVLANGLKWKAGDRILIPDIEFPTNVHPFLNLKRHGVEIDFLKSRNGVISPKDAPRREDIENAITSKTKLLSISHVQFFHGFKADLPAIGDICRRRGVLLSVDAIQSAGVVPIDVEEMKIDFLASGGQKWLIAPEGIAFIYVSERCQELIQQSYVGWMNFKNFFSDFLSYDRELEDSARRYENGTPNVVGLFGLPRSASFRGLHASLGMLLEVGISNIESHMRDLTLFLTSDLVNKNIRLVSPIEQDDRAGIVTCFPEHSSEVYNTLRRENIYVSLRENAIRFSPHFYCTQEEIERTLSVLEK